MEPTEKEMWAFWDNERKLFFHVYHQENIVRMCSPDYFQKAEKKGRGKVVKVLIKPLPISEKG